MLFLPSRLSALQEKGLLPILLPTESPAPSTKQMPFHSSPWLGGKLQKYLKPGEMNGGLPEGPPRKGVTRQPEVTEGEFRLLFITMMAYQLH